MDSFTETTSESWFGRLGNSIKSVLFGFVLFIAAFPVLWMNEGCSARTAAGLYEFKKLVVTVPADKVAQANDKKPVHVTAKATTEETLTDAEFEISAEKAIHLQREVEMFQWVEHKDEDKKKKVGGGTETVTTYDYKKEWSTSTEDSSNFKVSEGHENPDMPIHGTHQTAEVVKFGAFTLPGGLKTDLNNYEKLPAEKAPANLPEAIATRTVYTNDGIFYIGDDPSNPQIGDLRISFNVVKPADASVAAQQVGDSFEPWKSKTDTEIYRLMYGTKSSDEMVQQMLSENSMMTWIFRFVGFLMMTFGIAAIFNPLVVVADVIPILGDFLQGGILLFAGVIGAALSMITIGIAWLFYRPLYGIIFIIVAVALIVGLRFMLAGKRKDESLPESGGFDDAAMQGQ